MKMEENVLQVNIDDIIPNRFQPRLSFDEQGLKELASSIKEHGIIQPLVLRKLGNKYEIIAGERRYKASVMAGLTKVPAVISNIDDNSSAEIALVENIQRRNLTPIEEARSYKNLLDKGYTQEQLAQKMGISQSSVANKLRLLNLDESVQQALLEGKISERHARSLLILDDKVKEKEWLARIINERLTVRQLDQELKKIKQAEQSNDIPLVDINPNVDYIKKEAVDINKKNPKLVSNADDILTDYSEKSSSNASNGPKVAIIEDLDEAPKTEDILTNPYEDKQKTTFFETLEPLSTEDQAKQNTGNKGYFSFEFLQPEEEPPVKKDLEVLSSNTEIPEETQSNTVSYDNHNFTAGDVTSLNPNNKFFTPFNQSSNNDLKTTKSQVEPEELFDPMSLLDGYTSNNSLSKDDINNAKKDIENIINNLKNQGFLVDYNFESKDGGCKITIDINM